MKSKNVKIKRPLAIREMQAKKKKEDKGKIRIYNCSRQQIPIHLNAPKGVDFFLGAQDIRLNPGQYHIFNRNRVRMGQIERLQKQGMIQVISQDAD